ncbi:MAG: tRNA (N6-threonylcarbamoyladenosine(37)-N6)-methyltransferase TrmO [Acidobacteria bacterium]|nr:tRNA (N6-threonylcarbamoyladenosine(37)-N6)-methyltransferase TrmO [Acidobacteriota bacterium]
MEIKLKPIGIIHSPYKTRDEAPITYGEGREISEIEVYPEFEEGLADIEGFSHLVILFFLHKSPSSPLTVYPPFDRPNPRGVFATRAPDRPNPIGLSYVELVERKGRFLKVRGLDAIDGTPLIDIKPYIPALDNIEGVRLGWAEGKFKRG